MNPRVAELNYLMALGADDVIVLAITVRLLVVGEVAPELAPPDEVGLNEQIECIVHGSATDLEIFLFHAQIQRVYVEMTGKRIDLLQNREALRRLAQVFALEVRAKDLADFRETLLVEDATHSEVGHEMKVAAHRAANITKREASGFKPFHQQYAIDALKSLDETVEVSGIVDVNHNFPLEQTVVRVNRNRAHIHFE